ncbi:hypothetical protein U0C82_00140 [Fulvimarina sp. 2208YS6-2-32]|uniref:Uncharacterized protein n=1 Tax=Fulvimarina uroteuthidis TaxID=3098149 RepID=A0ABU5HWZ9_9HYPH|nr:hypothetical protein [Fulvimarina sp. 2208YS6-2-32]MDY8107555.1 hypothetical protein [Fulvimarina sp. 2208YS6-2-32]
MKITLLPIVAALVFLGACTSNNSAATTEINNQETPSDGIVPGQLPD